MPVREMWRKRNGLMTCGLQAAGNTKRQTGSLTTMTSLAGQRVSQRYRPTDIFSEFRVSAVCWLTLICFEHGTVGLPRGRDILIVSISATKPSQIAAFGPAWAKTTGTRHSSRRSSTGLVRAMTGAYGELIAKATDRLLRLTRKMLRNYPHLRRWEQTDDVFQRAAMRLYRSLGEVQPTSLV